MSIGMPGDARLSSRLITFSTGSEMMAAGNETSIASSNFNPNEIVAAWNDWRESPRNAPSADQIVRVGVAVSNDGGVTWTDFLVRPPPAFQTRFEGDPMTTYDDRTGTLWGSAVLFALSLGRKWYTGPGWYIRVNPAVG